MALSGWCGLRGRPDCARCQVADCSCSGCANPAENKAVRRGVETSVAVDLWENRDAPARCANTKRGLTESSLEGPG